MVAKGAYRKSMTVRRTGVTPVTDMGSSDQDESASAGENRHFGPATAEDRGGIHQPWKLQARASLATV